MFKNSGIAGKVAIVTGGSRGIGKAIVELLAQEGAEVHFFYRRQKDKAEQLQQQAQEQGLKVIPWQVDVCDKQQCQTIVENIFSQTGAIDILVNNSGVTRDNLLAAFSEEDVTTVVNTNVLGVFNVTQAVVPFMMSRRCGNIINVSSVSAEKGGRGQVNYAASKGAINAFTKSLAVELARKNITVNAVAPGVIATDMSQEIRELGGEEALSKILLKRYGEADDVAAAVAYLASVHAKYITGIVLPVDGGFKMA
jgi:3-oxoacyl-[acyl-carrier protein] reductase